jgi:hypothetical protein
VLFVLVLLSHERRHGVHVSSTEHPTATWMAQQVVNAFPDDTALAGSDNVVWIRPLDSLER